MEQTNTYTDGQAEQEAFNQSVALVLQQTEEVNEEIGHLLKDFMMHKFSGSSNNHKIYSDLEINKDTVQNFNNYSLDRITIFVGDRFNDVSWPKP